MKNLVSLTAILVSTMALGQTQWYEIPSNTTKHLRSIDFPSSSVGYIVGDSGVMLKSTNGGASWNPLNYSGIQVPIGLPNFTDVDFVDDLKGFAVVKNYSPGFYKTIDGGLNWVSDDPPSNMCYKRCVYPNDQDNWVLGGAGCFQSAMVDRRSTSGWTSSTINYESFNPEEYVVQMDFFNNIGIAAMNAPYMLRTIDSGITWDTISTGISALGVHTSVHFINPFTCYAGYDDNGGGFGILVSYDAGLTWQQDINSATFFYPAFLSVTSAANGDVYSGGRPSGWPDQGLIFEFDGVSWLYEIVGQPVNDMDSYGTDITFGVGDSGLIVVNIPVSVLGLDPEKPNENGAIENVLLYPNPAKDWVQISIDFDQLKSITLHDVHGRQMQVETKIIDGKLSLNVSDLPAGVYIFSISDGTRSIQKKFIRE